jgi:uncharacterized protein with HEPN domain
MSRCDSVEMRHKVVHDYLGVDEVNVRQVVRADLPPLIASLERILAAFSDTNNWSGTAPFEGSALPTRS